MAGRSHLMSVLFAQIRREVTQATHTLHNAFWTLMTKTSLVSVRCDDKFNMPQCAITRSGEVIYLWDGDCARDHNLSTPSPSLRWLATVSWRDPVDFLYQPWPGKHQTHRSDGLGRNKDYSLGTLPLDPAFSYLFLLYTNAHIGEHILATIIINLLTRAAMINRRNRLCRLHKCNYINLRNISAVGNIQTRGVLTTMLASSCVQSGTEGNRLWMFYVDRVVKIKKKLCDYSMSW